MDLTKDYLTKEILVIALQCKANKKKIIYLSSQDNITIIHYLHR